MLDISNEMYSNKGIAKIVKRPTPIKALRVVKGRIVKATYDKKSTVDYDGVYQGKSIQFEAKSVLDLARMPLDRIESHQYDHLVECASHGAVSFIIVYFAKYGITFVYPLERLKQSYRASEEGGRKSIPLSEFEEHGYEVKTGRVPVDYLVAVDAMMTKYA